MKSRHFIGIALAVVQLLVAFSAFIPQVRTLLGSDSTTVIVTLVGIEFVLLSTMIQLQFIAADHERTTFYDQVLTRLADFAVPVPLRAHEFYPHFLRFMREAKSTVFISYFAPYPPSKTGDAERLKYYEQQAELTKDRPDVRFRRLVRRSKDNFEWIKSLATERPGVKNWDLGVIRDAPDDERLPLAMSIQVIDDQHVWMVALETHEHEGRYRDIYVHSHKLGEGMSKYYNRLWNQSIHVVESGTLTKDGERFLKGM